MNPNKSLEHTVKFYEPVFTNYNYCEPENLTKPAIFYKEVKDWLRLRRYNNYSNYQTFEISQYIHNNGDKIQSIFLNVARQIIKNPPESDIYNETEKVRFGLADYLKSYFEVIANQSMRAKEAFLGAILGAALGQVDWTELADELLQTLKEVENIDKEGRVYRIIRFYKHNYKKRTLFTGLTLSEAQEHCNNPKTSDKNGNWFDGYDYIKGYRK